MNGKNNKETTVITSCPHDCGSMDELQKKYGEIQQAAGFKYAADTLPSIIIKPRDCLACSS